MGIRLQALDLGDERADAHAAAEDRAGEFGDAGQGRTAAREEDAGVEAVEMVFLVELGADDGEEFLEARVDDGVERAAGDRGGLEARHGVGHGDALLGVFGTDERGGGGRLELFGLRLGDGEGDADVVRDVVSADPDDAGLDEAAAGPGRERGRTAAEVDDERAVALVLRGEDGGGGTGAGEVVLLGGDFELGGVRGAAPWMQIERSESRCPLMSLGEARPSTSSSL